MDMTHTQLFNIRPQVKQRPRMTRRGRAYTPKKTHDFEQAVRDEYDGPLYQDDDQLVVSLVFDTDCFLLCIDFAEDTDAYNRFWDDLRLVRNVHMRSGDCDNHIKAVMDGLQSQKETDKRSYQAGAFDNDKAVFGVQACFATINPEDYGLAV